MVRAMSVGETAKEAAEQLGEPVEAREVSDAFYRGWLDASRCPVLGGRRLVSADYLSEVVRVLRERRALKRQRQERRKVS
jgi:hypothetical protein